MITLDRANPLLVDDVDLERAIAWRNIHWARMRDAEDLLAIARDEIGFHDLSSYIRQANETQDRYERAARELVRIRVWWRHDRAAACIGELDGVVYVTQGKPYPATRTVSRRAGGLGWQIGRTSRDPQARRVPR